MLIAQISDAHISAAGDLTCGVADMAKNLSACVRHINASRMPVNLVLVSGDVTHDGIPEQVGHAADLLNELSCPYFVVPGNHDDRDTLWQGFSGGACPDRVGEFICYSIDRPHLRIIGFDSLRRGQSGGEACAERLTWLEVTLARDPAKPTLIFMHHPPIECGVPETDKDGFIGATELGQIVRRFPNIVRIICGHIHLPTHAGWCGTIISTAPSVGMMLDLDLTQKHASRFLLSPPAYQLHHWHPKGHLISHFVQVTDLGDPQNFSHDAARSSAEFP